MLIQPLALECGTKVTYGYGTHHFEPKDGKVVGIWPYDYDSTNLYNLRTKWGYSGLMVRTSNLYDLAISNGFSKENLMFNIHHEFGTTEYINWVANNDCGYYYFDEPVDHACWSNGDRRLLYDWEFSIINDVINTYRPNSDFVISGYKRCDHLDYAVSNTDIIMYSEYDEWDQVTFPCDTDMRWGPSIEKAWAEGDNDQRSSWTAMKMEYGPKFNTTWINAYEITEYTELFGHAANLGMNNIWIYAATKDGNPVAHYDNFEGFSDAAFKAGYLRKFVTDYRIEWRCRYFDPCDCDPELADGWYIYNVREIPGTLHEIYP